jgi:hypothetical protein
VLTAEQVYTLPLAERIWQLADANGGVTYSVGADAQVTQGYAVSVFPDREVTLTNLWPDDVQRFIERNSELWANSENCLGAWRDHTGLWYLDVSKVLSDKGQALLVGQLYHQVAIYDLTNNADIPAVYPEVEKAA